jgi:hypothetical protein
MYLNMVTKFNIQMNIFYRHRQPILCFDQLDDSFDRINDQYEKVIIKSNENLY